MKTTITALALWAGVIHCLPAASAPRAQNLSECRFFWDVALVSRALAIEGIERKHAGRILGHIYNMQDDPRVIEIVYTILDTAYRQTGGRATTRRRSAGPASSEAATWIA